ncbi:hypothetical protein [Endozoicomonas euniceicola]|uniref:Glycosyltransferase RgtA/B/C/D-like domain-containing protein n=1 Tax=Endozoicomonas euniceicola TaxID=1234143 RepID=A0ABY6GYW7_9GAMM|nr:hypothetical protein [Endozoicomonas euniceicola]UYM17980.1 hypothetical protein NX720_08775 [Endozoicomonas euniceicola]
MSLSYQENYNKLSIAKHQDIVKITYFTVIASILLSFYYIANVELINKDGFYYIDIAGIFLKQGFAAAMAQYNWPFFPIIAAYIHSFLGFSLANSFYLISILSYGLIAYAFIKIAELVLPIKALPIASVVFLCAATINKHRDDIIRDHSYWAFALLATLFLIQAIYSKNWKKVIFSLMALSISIIFRPEGIIHFFLFPVIFICCTTNFIKTISRNKLTSIIILASSILTLYCTFYLLRDTKLATDILKAVRFDRTLESIFTGAEILNNYFLPKYSHHYSVHFMIAGITSIFLLNIIASLGTLYLVAILLDAKCFINWIKENTIIIFLTISFSLPIILFVYKHYFLSPRYTVLISLISLLPVTYIFYKNILNNKRKKYLAYFLIFASFIDSTVSFNHTSKKYITDAAEWVNSTYPDNHLIVTNDPRLNYLVNGNYISTPEINLDNINKNADILLFNIRRKDKHTLSKIKDYGLWKESKRFYNNKNDFTIVLTKI